MMCKDYNCPKTCPYPEKGREFFDRQGYCGFADLGPNKKVVKTSNKVRAGQQKQKKS
jgi:hypothetical protein